MKYHKLAAPKKTDFFGSWFWKLEVQNQDVGRVGFILRFFSLACSWPFLPSHIFTCSSFFGCLGLNLLL